MRRLLSVVWNDDEGQDLVEYALLLVFIAIVVAAALPPVTDAIKPVFDNAAKSFKE